MYLSPAKMRTLARVIQTLAEPYGEAQVRELVGHQLLELLDADYYASYVWNDSLHRFAGRVALHMDDANLACYESYYQFCDPITPPDADHAHPGSGGGNHAAGRADPHRILQ